MERQRRTFDELNVIDDFLFNEIIQDKKHGKEFIRVFLETILGKKITVKHVVAQEVITSGDPKKRGIRLDIITDVAVTQPEGAQKPQSTINVEMNAQKKQIGIVQQFDIRRRSRFYQSLIDCNMLDTRQGFGELSDVVIIFCMPYDIFGKNRAKYTFEYMCLEDATLHLRDGAKRVFLNIKGDVGASKELCDLLRYIEESTEQNITDTKLKAIHEMIVDVKSAKERRERYMFAFEKEAMARYEGEEQGLERANKLTKILMDSMRTDDLIRALNDKAYQQELFRKFGI